MGIREQRSGLNDRVALVTGGGSGIGMASALAFAKAGAKVVIADLNAASGNKTVSQITALGRDGLFIETDVSQAEEVESLISQIVKVFGRLDFAHNNAGIAGKTAKTADCTEDNWDHVISTNLKSIWLCMKYEIGQMCQQHAGVIVNTSSVLGLIGSTRGLPAYVASKHGIIGLTKTVALEYAAEGIRINVVCPGAIDTPFRLQIGEPVGTNTDASQRYPIGRIGKPEDVADAVVWLCSEEASFITGATVVIDGGLTAREII